MNYPKIWEGKGKGICQIQKFPDRFFKLENTDLLKDIKKDLRRGLSFSLSRLLVFLLFYLRDQRVKR